MNIPYDHEALWVKAKLFINRATDDTELRSFDERALWASLSLELLGKAALARISPLLIAEPTEDGSNLLIATGLMSGDARFTSVRAKTIFSRCQKAFKPFSLKESMAMANARNEYLHGGGVGFLAIPQDVWWSRFWAQVDILISAMDKDLEDFVGHDKEDMVNDFLEKNAKNVEHRTQALLERAKQRLRLHREGNLPARVAAEWKSHKNLSPGLRHQALHECPACGGEGVMEGEEVEDVEYEYERISEEDYDLHINLTVLSEYFTCPTCQLILDRVEYIDQAGLPTEFATYDEYGDHYPEPEYGND